MSAEERADPEEFELWWETSPRRDPSLIGYGLKKVLAYEAFSAGRALADRAGQDAVVEAAFKEAYQFGFLEGYECEPRYTLDEEGTVAALRFCEGASEAWTYYKSTAAESNERAVLGEGE